MIFKQFQLKDLNFDFKFYGIVYDEITVSADGWISFGRNNIPSFRNHPIPGAGGPSPMIAAFWDDLTTNNQSGVYYLIDEEEESVIIEWSNMRTYNQNSIETFQIILYDAVTPTGDDEIKIQYKEFNNTSSSNKINITVLRNQEKINFVTEPDVVDSQDAFGNPVKKKIIGIKIIPVNNEFNKEKRLCFPRKQAV